MGDARAALLAEARRQFEALRGPEVALVFGGVSLSYSFGTGRWYVVDEMDGGELFSSPKAGEAKAALFEIERILGAVEI